MWLWLLACSDQPEVSPAVTSPPAVARFAPDLVVAPVGRPAWGSPITFQISGLAPGETAYLGAGLAGEGAGPCPAPLGGACWGLAGSVRVVGSGVADLTGVASVRTTLPAAGPDGSALSVQAASRRGPGEAWLGPVRTDPIDPPWRSGLDRRPPNPSCLAPATGPVVDRRAQLVRVFPSLTFDRPTKLLQAPGDDRYWYLAEKVGRVWRFENRDDVEAAELVIDLTDRVFAEANEAGLLGIAFHPNFSSNGEVFLSYDTGSMEDGLVTELVRYSSPDGGRTLDPDSGEWVLTLDQPFKNHNGGEVAFGPDGLLYLALGDGGSGGDPLGHGQNTDTLLGAILRIDVDRGIPYGIPLDNPFADGVSGAPEIYAWGFRNPWRFSFDRATGELWVGDVGQHRREEIDLVRRGGNYGWNVREGATCYDAPSCASAGLVDPVAEWPHDGPQALIGGYVYRGSALPELVGSYLYADYYESWINALYAEPSGERRQVPVLTGHRLSISSFAEDLDGELSVLDYGGGGVWALVPPDAVPPVDPFPRRLSETGCFDPAAPWQPVPALLPYELNAPFWSDGAEKSRYFALPDESVIGVGDDGDLDLPVGSVVAKVFSVEGQRVETRLMMRHADGEWAGYTYVWRPDGSDADLALGGATVEVAGGLWHAPSSGDCAACHTAAAGYTLGLELAQANREQSWPSGRVAHQVVTWQALGLLDPPVPEVPSALPALARYDEGAAPVAARAASYLHSNCSNCHRPGGPGLGDLDLRWTASDVDRGCNRAPVTGDVGVEGALVVAPGDLAHSALSLRLHATDVWRMPPLGSDLVDPEGTSLVDSWINGLDPSCGSD